MRENSCPESIHTTRTTQPLPTPPTQVQRILGGTAGEESCASGRALFHISLRTGSPSIASAIERNMAAAFVADLAPGCLQLMGSGGAVKAAAPRVQVCMEAHKS